MKNLINQYRNSEKNFEINLESTSDSKIYKRLRKEQTCSCSYCDFHCNENFRGKHYSTYRSLVHLKFPNWKLVSKNKKQYFAKNTEVFENITSSYVSGETFTYYTVEWKDSFLHE